MKRFQPKETPAPAADEDDQDEPPSPGGGRNRDVDFKGVKRSNATHASTTDADARLYKKARGQAARPCFMGHALMGHVLWGMR